MQKVLHLMSVYNGMSGKESNLEQSYILLDLAGQVALRVSFFVHAQILSINLAHSYHPRCSL